MLKSIKPNHAMIAHFEGKKFSKNPIIATELIDTNGEPCGPSFVVVGIHIQI